MDKDIDKDINLERKFLNERLITQLIDFFYSMKVCTIKQISNTLFLIITNDSSIHYLFKIHYFF